MMGKSGGLDDGASGMENVQCETPTTVTGRAVGNDNHSFAMQNVVKIMH